MSRPFNLHEKCNKKVMESFQSSANVADAIPDTATFLSGTWTWPFFFLLFFFYLDWNLLTFYNLSPLILYDLPYHHDTLWSNHGNFKDTTASPKRKYMYTLASKPRTQKPGELVSSLVQGCPQSHNTAILPICIMASICQCCHFP